MPTPRVPDVVDIEVRRTEAVVVTWEDDRVSTFGLAELRGNCPCAACRSVRDRGEVPWPPPGEHPEALAVEGAELVGAWGLSLTWNDGHGTGIFPWESLRRWDDERRARTGPVPGPPGDGP